MSAAGDVLKVYVLPVSGGWFPMQLMLLGQVYQARLLNAGGRFKSAQEYTPDICCAASGGNIATYIAMAGDWSDAGISRVSSNIHSEMFCRNWWPGYMTFLPTWVLGIFAGALFRTGYGANMLLDKIFTPSTIQKTEIWTGTFNQSTRTCELFCNKKPGETYVWPLTYNRFLYRSMPLNFLRGNMMEIGKAIMASASIPFIFNSQTIGNHEYADGGIMYASPLTPLQDEICRIVTGVAAPPQEVMLAPPIQISLRQAQTQITEFKDLQSYSNLSRGSRGPSPQNSSNVPRPSPESLQFSHNLGQEFDEINEQIEGLPRTVRKMQLIYFACVNVDEIEIGCKNDGLSHMVGTIRGFTVSITLQDRVAAINILTQIAGGRRDRLSFFSYPVLNVTKLAGLLREIEPYDYVLYLYVGNNPPLDMTSFKTDAINECIQRENLGYSAHVWVYKP